MNGSVALRCDVTLAQLKENRLLLLKYSTGFKRARVQSHCIEVS